MTNPPKKDGPTDLVSELTKAMANASKAIEDAYSQAAEGMRRTNNLNAVRTELERQDAKWGVQNHPNISSVIKDNPELQAKERTSYLADYANHAEFYKELNDKIVKEGEIGWDTILLEEVYEALEQDDTEKLLAELDQVAAVAMAYKASIQRRA